MWLVTVSLLGFLNDLLTIALSFIRGFIWLGHYDGMIVMSHLRSKGTDLDGHFALWGKSHVAVTDSNKQYGILGRSTVDQSRRSRLCVYCREDKAFSFQ